jgi:hypothetical protein
MLIQQFGVIELLSRVYMVLGIKAVRFVYEGVEQTHQGIEAELTWYPSSQTKN